MQQHVEHYHLQNGAYIVRADTAYAAYGTIDIGILALGTSNTNTNSVLWSDGKTATTTAEYWVNQGSTYIQNASPLTSSTISGTYDQTAPTITSITMYNGATAGGIFPLDYFTIGYSEPIDASTINTTLVPGGSVAGLTGATTVGTALVAQATCVVTVYGITTFACGASVATAVSAPTNTIALSSDSKTLTVTWTALTGGGTITTPANMAAGTQVATTVKDANAVASAAVATAVPTGAF